MAHFLHYNDICFSVADKATSDVRKTAAPRQRPIQTQLCIEVNRQTLLYSCDLTVNLVAGSRAALRIGMYYNSHLGFEWDADEGAAVFLTSEVALSATDKHISL